MNLSKMSKTEIKNQIAQNETDIFQLKLVKQDKERLEKEIADLKAEYKRMNENHELVFKDLLGISENLRNNSE